MDKDQGEHWHCMNAACGKEVVLDLSAEMDTPPHCSCGAVMKKQYSPPVFRYLDFLYLEETIFADRALPKD